MLMDGPAAPSHEKVWRREDGPPGSIFTANNPDHLTMRVLWNIKPTAEQLVILGDARTGFRLIRGAAGSGKTTVALMRLRQLCAARVERKRRQRLPEPVRVLVLTFNRTLRGYVQHLATEQVNTSEDIELAVETFSHWAIGLYASYPKLVDQRQQIRHFLVNAGFTADLEYFVGEVEYVLGRFPPDKQGDYREAERSGRGRAEPVNDIETVAVSIY